MKILLTLSWSVLLFVLTCTTNVEHLFRDGIISFHWTSQPNITEMFLPLPVNPESAFIIRKFGHMFAFFVFTLLLYFNFFSKIIAFSIGGCYGGLTEVLQLFFNRDGRVFDISFDLIGVCIAILLVILSNKIVKKPIVFK